MTARIQIAILDSHRLSLHGLAAIAAQHAEQVAVTALVSDPAHLYACLQNAQVDVLLLDDLFPPSYNTTLFFEQLRSLFPNLKLIVRSHKLHMGYIQHLFQLGVQGFLHKEDALETTLLPAILNVSRNQYYLSPRAALLPYQEDKGSDLGQLSSRDLSVLQLLHDGFKIQEIAEQLHLTPKIIYRTRDKLKQALGVKTNEQLIPMAQDRGIL